jgi:S-(hydroxymethyl)glutathione dehydrogenase / alcohol dehydrogenase
MKAAVCRKFKKPLIIEDIQLAAPGASDIKVKIAACGICHSDIHFIEGAWGGTLPAVYGHEGAGIVQEVGRNVRHVKPGDHVVLTLVRYCGTCHACAAGEQVLCESTFPLTGKTPLSSRKGAPITHGLGTGAFAEYVVVDGSQAVAIPKDVPFASASLIGCAVITGMGAVINTAGVTAGSSVVVIGTGGVGLNSIQGAALAGASPIIAADLVKSKLRAAKRFGATHTVDAASGDVAKTVKRITGGRGADYVFVTVGAKPAIEQAFGLMRRGGNVVLVGMPALDVRATFDPVYLANDGQRIIGSKMGSSRIQIDVPKIVELYKQGRVKLDELITKRYPLEKINEAISAVARGEALRNVIVF